MNLQVDPGQNGSSSEEDQSVTHVSPVINEVTCGRNARRSASDHWVVDQHAVDVEVGRVICVKHVAADEGAVCSGISIDQSEDVRLLTGLPK